MPAHICQEQLNLGFSGLIVFDFLRTHRATPLPFADMILLKLKLEYLY